MRAYIPSYELRVPRDFGEALHFLSREPGVWKAFAGGTDLMVLLEAGQLSHRRFINVWGLPELCGIDVNSDYVTLGALTTYTQLQKSPILQEEFPMLCQAASETGGIAIQNRGTLGGNIANASPAGDSLPPLLAYDAELELVSTSGTRWVSYHRFHTGYKQTVMDRTELIRRIRLPRSSDGWRYYYRKVGTRRAQAISKVGFAARARLRGSRIVEVRIALGSVAPVPLRCVQTEESLREREPDENTISEALAKIAGEISPIEDIRSTADYRLGVTLNLFRHFLTGLRAS